MSIPLIFFVGVGAPLSSFRSWTSHAFQAIPSQKSPGCDALLLPRCVVATNHLARDAGTPTN